MDRSAKYTLWLILGVLCVGTVLVLNIYKGQTDPCKYFWMSSGDEAICKANAITAEIEDLRRRVKLYNKKMVEDALRNVSKY